VAAFNRGFANQLVGPVLTRLPGFATVCHRGRRSGREYRTPVKVFRNGTGYIIALPYGSGADWVKNVLAAGGCELMTRGRRLRMVEPTLVDDDGASRIPAFARMVLSRLRSTQLLELTPAEPAAVRKR
jgi:deazaflavin-dependent oxidoreductase (nitroreductase family)